VSRLRLFKKMEFLGPGRRVRTLLNSVTGLTAPARTVVSVKYKRPGDRQFATTTVTHDLAVYREVAYRI
jgi:hypothetical protein